MTKKLFGEIVKDIRRKKKISQQDLAKSTNLSRQIIIKIEKGESDIRLTTLLKIAKGLRVEPYQLFSRERLILADKRIRPDYVLKADKEYLIIKIERDKT